MCSFLPNIPISIMFFFPLDFLLSSGLYVCRWHSPALQEDHLHQGECDRCEHGAGTFKNKTSVLLTTLWMNIPFRQYIQMESFENKEQMFSCKDIVKFQTQCHLFYISLLTLFISSSVWETFRSSPHQSLQGILFSLKRWIVVSGKPEKRMTM